MSRTEDPQVGERIREERTRLGLSLRALARRLGVSASLISQIETGKCQPSVSTLYAITTTLGISIEHVFEPAGAGRPGGATPPRYAAEAVSVAAGSAAPIDGTVLAGSAAQVAGAASAYGGPAAHDRPAAHGQASACGPASAHSQASPHSQASAVAALHAAAASAAHRAGKPGRTGERGVLKLDSGVTWERLGHVPGVPVDFLLVTYPPGASSSTAGELMRHAGAEYAYLMEGELILTLGDEEQHLTPGQSVSFASSTPHKYRNDGAQPAIGIWFVSGQATGVFSVH